MVVPLRTLIISHTNNPQTTSIRHPLLSIHLLNWLYSFTKPKQPFTHPNLNAGPTEWLRKTKRDFNFPYIYHKKGEGGEGYRRGQFKPLDADLTRSAFTLPAKLVAYWITHHLPLMRQNSRLEIFTEASIVSIATSIRIVAKWDDTLNYFSVRNNNFIPIFW